MRILIQANGLSELNLQKDDTYYIATTALKRNHEILWSTPVNIMHHADGLIHGHNLAEGREPKKSSAHLADIDLLLIRQNPPVDAEYCENINKIHTLTMQYNKNIKVINHPGNIANFWEKKLPSIICPNLIPKTLFVAKPDKDVMGDFLYSQLSGAKHYIAKPFNLFGGSGVALMEKLGDIKQDIKEILHHFTQNFILQEFIPEVVHGDKRVILANGQIIAYFTRKPAPGGYITNTAMGSTILPCNLDTQETKIIMSLAPHLIERGILYAGLDMIGHNIIEINTTSPMGLNKYDELHHTSSSVNKFWQIMEDFVYSNAQ